MIGTVGEYGYNAIVKCVFKQDAFTYARKVYTELMSLMMAQRNDRETIMAYELRLQTIMIRINPHFTDNMVPESFFAFMLVGIPNLDRGQ